jgi:hypothetical protein
LDIFQNLLFILSFVIFLNYLKFFVFRKSKEKEIGVLLPVARASACFREAHLVSLISGPFSGFASSVDTVFFSLHGSIFRRCERARELFLESGFPARAYRFT